MLYFVCVSKVRDRCYTPYRHGKEKIWEQCRLEIELFFCKIGLNITQHGIKVKKYVNDNSVIGLVQPFVVVLTNNCISIHKFVEMNCWSIQKKWLNSCGNP